MTKEALKLALEALEQLQGGCTDHNDGTVEAITVWCPEVIAAIKEALAQPEQRQWVGLTIYEIDDAFNESMKVRPKEASNAETRRLFAHAIEAKLKEKNYD